MNNMDLFLRRAAQSLIASLSITLAACGGGGSSSAGLQTGTFGLVPVDGLRYTTATQSGVTSDGGNFNFKKGETVTFYLGNLELGTADASSELSLFDLLSVPIPQSQDELLTYFDTNPDRSPLLRLTNLAVALHTLDEDFNSTNGITISPQVAERFSASSANMLVNWGYHTSRPLREFLYQAANEGL